MKYILFLLGSFLPFSTLGPSLPNMVWIAPSIFIGFAAFLVSSIQYGVGTRFLAAFVMVLGLLMTAMARHPFYSYGLSILAFSVAICPLLISNIHGKSTGYLLRGYLYGYFITLVLIACWILSQIFGFSDLYESLSPFREASLHFHNFYVFYIRPQAGFAEPAHLAIYLSFSYVIFDHFPSGKQSILKLSALIAIFLTGSMVGFALISFYLAVKFFSSIHLIFHSWRSTDVFVGAIWVLISLIFTLFFALKLPDMFSLILERASLTLQKVTSQDISGSEGSRANTWVILFDYWKDAGLIGFLFGEGYGNISEWLISRYYNIEWSSASDGRVDNMLVSLALSSGIVGLVVYFIFIRYVFIYFRASRNIPIIGLFIISHFASGALIIHWKWHLLLVLLAVAKSQNATVPLDSLADHSTSNPLSSKLRMFEPYNFSKS